MKIDCRFERPAMKLNCRQYLQIAIVLVLSLTPSAFSQVITADLVGTVTDPAGATIAHASVTVKNNDTGISRTMTTESAGEYVFNLLPPGHYSLTIDAQGFKAYKVSDVSLSAGTRPRVDVQLQVGMTSETVDVGAAAPLLQTDSSSVGSSIAEETVSDIPLNGRNITNLITQQVGVNAGMPGSITAGSRPDDRRQSSEVSANGQREYYNSNFLDGIDNTERFYGLGGIKPSVEGIQEVNVQTNNFPADVGRAAGAVVTVVTKSGANGFHGSLYEFFRNDKLNAWDRFKSAHKSEWRQNQYGGSVSGPIIKDKTFFYFDLEQFRLVQGITSPAQEVPSAADDATVAGLTTPDPVGALVFSLYPAPNVPGNNFASGCDNASAATLCEYISNPKKTQNSTTIDARVDHHISANDSIFGRYSYNPVTSFFPAFFPAVSVNGKTIQPAGAGFIANGNFPGANSTKSQGAEISYTHIFTQRLLMNLRAGFTRINIDSETINKGDNAGGVLGIPNANDTGDPNATGMPGFHFLNGYADLGDQIAYPIHNINNTYQANGDVLYSRGNQNFKIGAALIRRQVNYLQEFAATGWLWFFSPMQMAGETVNIGFPLPGGIVFPFANRQQQWHPEYARSWEPSFYVQDDWHARPWLTLNLGVRYDIFTPFTEAHGRIANFDLNTLKLDIGGTGGIKTDHGDIAPRIGFAAQLGHGTVLRGGYGITYYPGDTSGAITLYNPPFNNSITAGFFPLDAGPPSSPAYVDPSIIYSPDAGGLGLVAKQINYRASYLHQYNLIFQQQLGNNSLSLGYVGSLGRRQLASGGPDANLPYPDSTGTFALDSSGSVGWYYSAQLPGIHNIGTYFNEYTSNYNALQASFDHRFSRGLTANVNYTWAHGLNDWSGYESGGNEPSLWKGNSRYDYGNSDLDIRHRIALTATYNLPFGKSLNGAEAAALKGWSLSSSAYFQTGLPFTVTDANKPQGAFQDFNVGVRPNVVPGQSFYMPGKPVGEYLNPAAFNASSQYTATTFTLGNERVNQIYGPHQRQVDLSLYKNFNFTEAVKMQFRAECYNVSNSPNFAEPTHDLSVVTFNSDGTVKDPGSFGQIQYVNAGTFPRVWQFALKFSF
jgi:Carboxypeptidase regulatory-like domain